MAREAVRAPRFNWRLWFRVSFWFCVCLTVAMAARQLRHFAISDPHFVLPDASSQTGTANFGIEGVVYSSRERILQAFDGDFGRSVFLISLGERRRRLLAVDWVEDATVSRIWPNRLWVRIRERTPVAFVSFPQGRSGSRIALIDANGVILAQPPKSHFSFPLVTGLTEDQSESERGARIRYMLRVENELGPLAKQVSELDLSEPENLKVTLPVDGNAMELILGDRNFAARCQNFLSSYPEIKKRSPRATMFDLRLDDRITAKGDVDLPTEKGVPSVL